MNLDDRLAEAFRAKAATARTSPEAFTIIHDRVRRQRRLRMLEIAGAGLAVPAVIVVALVATRPATREPRVADTPPVTSSPTETASPAPSPTATPTDESAYADAIAIARPGGVVDLISPSGTLLSRIGTFKGGSIGHLEWSPDRTEVYVSLGSSTPTDVCDPPNAMAIDVRAKKARELGAWTDFAFSSDGSQLAAVDVQDCGPATLLVRNLATGKERRLPAAGGDAASASFSSLAWVPGVDRIVLAQHGPGDSADLWLIDLSTATAINDGTRLDVGDAEAGETVAAATYAGNRLIVALVCCLNAPERLRVVERIGTTGDVRELLVVANRWGSQLHTSPDGKYLAFVASNSGGQQHLWVWDSAGDAQQMVDDVVAIAW